MCSKGRRELTRLVCVVVAVCMVYSACAAAFAANASAADADRSWAAQTLKQWLDKGWLHGYPDGSVRPERFVTRGEFAAFANKAFGITKESGAEFVDLSSSDWTYKEISRAVGAGYIHGYEDGTVRAGRAVSRQEAAVMLASLLKLEGSKGDIAGYTDTSAMAPWSLEAIQAVSGLKVMSGYPDGTFRPGASMTRAEAVVSIDRALQAAAQITGEGQTETDTRDDGAEGSAFENKPDLPGGSQPANPVPPVVPSTGISLGEEALTMGVGESVKLVPTIFPEHATDKSVIWQSDRSDVAAVDANGVVTAVATGSATITATTIDSSQTAAKAVQVSGTKLPDKLTDTLKDWTHIADKSDNWKIVTAAPELFGDADRAIRSTVDAESPYIIYNYNNIADFSVRLFFGSIIEQEAGIHPPFIKVSYWNGTEYTALKTSATEPKIAFNQTKVFVVRLDDTIPEGTRLLKLELDPVSKANSLQLSEVTLTTKGDIESNTYYYSLDLADKLNRSIVLYEGGYFGYVNNSRTAIDKEHPFLRPVLIDHVAMAPASFLAAGMDTDMEWDASALQATITRGGITAAIEAEQPYMTVNGTRIDLDQPATMGEGGLLVPAGNIATAFGLHLEQDDLRKVWVVSEQPSVLDPSTDALLLDELADARYGVRKPELSIAQTAPPPEHAKDQKASFAERNSPQAIEALAKHLQDALRDDAPGLAEFRTLMASEQYQDALKAFQSYFFDKLLAMKDFDWASAVAPKALSSTQNVAEELLFNVIRDPEGGITRIGEPGEVNWHYREPTGGYDSDTTSLNTYMWHPVQFGRLINAAVSSGNPAYLEKWAEYIDDWALHSIGFKEILPQHLSDSDFNPAGVVNSFVSGIRNMANSPTREVLPAQTLVRFLLRVVEEYPPLSIEYMNSNPQNWSTQEFPALIVNGLLLDEFKDARLYLREGIRRMEDMAVTHMMPDGTDSEQSISYNREYLRFGAGLIYPFLQNRPDLLPADEAAELLGHMWDRAKLMAHTLQANGQYPGGFRIDTRDWVATVRDLLKGGLPEALGDSNIAAILAIGSSKNDQAAEASAPSFLSERFPYGGYSFIREGWRKQDQAAFLFSSGHPGNYDYYSQTGNNMFWLSAYGQDMLVPGEVGAYHSIPTPVLVDGMEQNGNYGIPLWGHRHVMASAWDEPEELRWGESDHFNLTEGLYDRHYGDSAGTDDVAHGRVLQFLRDAGLWVVTDRMAAASESHTYTVNWRLPSLALGPRGTDGYKAFTPTNITVNSQGREATLRTNDDGMANLSIYQFGTGELTSDGEVYFDPAADKSYKISDFYKYSTTFGGAGDQALVSLIVPRASVSNDIASIEPLGGAGTTGFKAVLTDGRTVQYLATANKNEQLTIDGVAVQGESLLLSTEANGLIRGVALGVNGFSIDSVPQSPGLSDFEFTIDSGRSLQVTSPIYKPIANVQITPEANVFTNQVQVAMTDATAGVEIRYTTDGSEPTLASALYTGPFTLTDTTVVKARAFRSGLAAIPNTATGTLASSTRLAVFTKQSRHPAASVAGSEAGLHYRYYEGDWKDMIYRMDRMTPVQEGDASGLFDFTAKQTNDPYGFAYSGYLNVPTDGIYTFYAPREWLRPDIMAGYDLEVYVDGEMWYPATRRQAFGAWSISLAQGAHTFEVRYVDYRGDSYSVYNTGVQKRIWNGTTPALEISGPGLTRQSIPTGMLIREP